MYIFITYLQDMLSNDNNDIIYNIIPNCFYTNPIKYLHIYTDSVLITNH